MNRQTLLKMAFSAMGLLICLTGTAQSSYDDYTYSEKTYKYIEDFDGSSSYWDTDEPGRRTAKIVDGYLDFRSLNDKTQVKYKTIDVDWSGNWELEIGITWAGGKETSAVDFIWDKEGGNSNKFHFGFTGGGKYVIAEYKNSEYNHIVKFKASPYVYKSSRNILTVRKVGQTYYLFFNRNLVKTMNYKPVKGDMIGFTVPPNSRIKVDHLYAYELKSRSTNTGSTTTSSTSSSSYSSYGSSDRTKVYREDFDGSDDKWEVYRSGARMGKIANGSLDWISLNDKAQLIWHTEEGMDWDRDWQIETRVKFVEGKPNSSNDLVWDIDDDGKNKYHFGFTGQGKYVFSKKVGSEYQTIVPFTESSLVRTSGFNKITVRKVGSTYYYYFNERLITTKSYHTVTSDKVGFMVAPNTTIQIDYLDISYLKKRTTTASTRSSSDIDSNGGFVAVMTKGNGYSVQRWKTRDNFPKDAIKEDWDDGYSISDVSYDNEKWSLVMSKGTGYGTQQWKTRYEFPKADIKELWGQSYKITELNYGNGVWGLVMSKNSGLERQRWSTRSEFPTEKIKEFGDEGLYITELIYGKDRWALVSSKDSDIRGQRWSKTNDFPYDKIRANTNDGYAITQLSYEKDLWILIMTKYNDGRSQVWFNTDEFPKAKIREYWDKGYYLTDLTYKATSSPSYTLGGSTDTETTTSADLKSKLLGRWYGGSEGEEKGYMTFYSDDIMKMVSGGETVGGYNYKQDGVKIDVKYEWSSTNNPNQLDIMFYSDGNSFGSLKGIIRFLDDDTFEYKLASELNDSRPSSFSNTASNKVATFSRQN